MALRGGLFSELQSMFAPPDSCCTCLTARVLWDKPIIISSLLLQPVMESQCEFY